VPRWRCASLGRVASRLDPFAPDIVHAFTEMPVGLAGRTYAVRSGIRLVTSSHTDYPSYVRHWGLPAASALLERWMRWFHSAATVTLCPSRTYAELLRARGVLGDVQVWGRGVDGDHFSPARATEAARLRIAGPARNVVLGVGRLMPEKRFDRLIDAYAALPPGLRDTTRLVIVGEGPSRRRLEGNRPAGVVFTGALRGIALAEAYATSDVFVLPSDEETFGNVVLEAMASGLPVIVSSRGAPHELVSPTCGAVVDMDSPGALVASLQRVLTDPALRVRLGRRAREDALARPWAAATAQVLRAYARARAA
jgi:glycosyltransferase involved in cell wall biosynthesis